MNRSLLLVVCACAGFLTAGCGHLDLSPEGNPNRVITGTVNVHVNLLPPPDSEVVVRLVEPPDVTAAPTTATNDLVIGERGTREQPERVLQEQVIHAPTTFPVPFRIEYRADDAELQHGLNIEARISWGHRVRFRTVEAQAVTLANADAPHVLWLEPAQ